MMDELGHQQGPRWMGVIHQRGEPIVRSYSGSGTSTPFGARARRTEAGGQGAKLKGLLWEMCQLPWEHSV